MALGAATVQGRFGHDSRPGMMDILRFAGDSAYLTGGTANFRAYVRQAVGRGALDIIAVLGLDAGGNRIYYDRATDKLKISVAAGTEVVNATDLSATTFTVLVISC
jgi:hypothetical protein